METASIGLASTTAQRGKATWHIFALGIVVKKVSLHVPNEQVICMYSVSQGQNAILPFYQYFFNIALKTSKITSWLKGKIS